MQEIQQPAGSASRWGPLFGAHAEDWAETWEGPQGWGTPVYEYVLDRTRIGPGTRVLDCGCGAGRFARMAADAGAAVAGIDASEALIDIAVDRTPQADLRVGDLEALPWPDDAFDVVTGFSAFQFADGKVQALAEAGRVSCGMVVVVIPTRVPEAGIAAVFKPLFPLFPPDALETMKRSGMFALSDPGALDEALAASGLSVHEDEDIDCPVGFSDADSAARAFIGAGPMQLAIDHAGKQAVAETLQDALVPFTGADDKITLPATYRVVLAGPQDPKR
ncbi:MAG: methyltransferase domain-containing protein [Nitriliruptorales bacterium]|nr:methyltransferase domain-containing protein [Nitriliruptorales bacterium]